MESKTRQLFPAEYKQKIQELDSEIHAFLSLAPVFTGKAASQGNTAETGLKGLPFAVKDNIAVEGLPLTCGSKMLERLVAPYTATAVSRLESAGAIPVGKTNLDEFGMGSATENEVFGACRNPWDTERVAGGSSGGSAAAVAAGMVPFALGSDTGGSVRQPAGFCGVYGLKPTYGAISRFGLTAYASSLETIGIFTRDLPLMRTVFRCTRGIDERDQTSINWDAAELRGEPARKIAFLKEPGQLHADVAAVYKAAEEQLRDLGYAIEYVELKSLRYATAAYYTIATAEASANLARYNGIRYGLRPIYAESPDELMRLSRTEGFGSEVKARILLGTYVLRSGFQDQFYIRAQKIRTLLYNELQGIFGNSEGSASGCDALMLPVFPGPAFLSGGRELDSFAQKQADCFTTLANLSGSPACAFPMEIRNGLPIGLQLMGPHGSDERLLDCISELTGDAAVQNPPLFTDCSFRGAAV